MEDIFHLGVKAVIRNKKGDILLLNSLISHNKSTYWDLPGGRIQRNEDPIAALKREVEEETGITELTDIRHLATALSNIRVPFEDSDVGLVLSAYAAGADTSTIKLSDEHLEERWVSPAEAAELLSVKFPAEICQAVAKL